MNLATATSIPVKTIFLDESILNAGGKLYGKASNIISLSTTAATLPGTPPQPLLESSTGGAIFVQLLPPADTGSKKWLNTFFKIEI